jgi:hypothetical protein
MYTKFPAPVRFAIAVIAAGCVAADATGQPDELVTARLSPEVRSVIVQEMQAIDAAMRTIHSALVAGDHATVAREAHHIHDSFVLAQTLSPAQRDEIGRVLPPSFVAADRQLHQLAARLAVAAEESDAHLARLWFQEMTRACQACHAEHAAPRFPGLSPPAADDSGHHGAEH